MKNMSKFIIACTLMLFASQSSFAAKKGKDPYKKAKAECLKENPALKGKSLQSCIKMKNAPTTKTRK